MANQAYHSSFSVPFKVGDTKVVLEKAERGATCYEWTVLVFLPDGANRQDLTVRANYNSVNRTGKRRVEKEEFLKFSGSDSASLAYPNYHSGTLSVAGDMFDKEGNRIRSPAVYYDAEAGKVRLSGVSEAWGLVHAVYESEALEYTYKFGKDDTDDAYIVGFYQGHQSDLTLSPDLQCDAPSAMVEYGEYAENLPMHLEEIGDFRLYRPEVVGEHGFLVETYWLVYSDNQPMPEFYVYSTNDDLDPVVAGEAYKKPVNLVDSVQMVRHGKMRKQEQISFHKASTASLSTCPAGLDSPYTRLNASPDAKFFDELGNTLLAGDVYFRYPGETLMGPEQSERLSPIQIGIVDFFGHALNITGTVVTDYDVWYSLYKIGIWMDKKDLRDPKHKYHMYAQGGIVEKLEDPKDNSEITVRYYLSGDTTVGANMQSNQGALEFVKRMYPTPVPA